MNFWDKKEAKALFQKLFCSTFIEKTHIKFLKNIDLQHELPFYEELSIENIWKALKNMQEVIKLK